jgi:hypothetical protein
MTPVIQDRTGTAAQLTLADAPFEPVAVGDTGTYTGLDWNGVEQTMDFTVGQEIDGLNFGITTMTPDGAPGTVLSVGWPKQGTITWLTGTNALASPNSTVVVAENPANAYCTVEFFESYHQSRGNPYPASPADAIQTAIVQATDYLDQRYRFKGIKLFQFLADNPAYDPAFALIDPWLANFGWLGGTGAAPGMNFTGLYVPSYTIQKTAWPRQGVVDANGDNVYGVPLIVGEATCEAALRVLNGTPLQPDYDPYLVRPGGVVASVTKEVGPIRTTHSFDTKLGLSFFPSIPHVDRMLKNAGIIVGGGGRRVIR